MDEKRTGAPAFTIAKTEPDKMLVFGWGSVAVDADGTQIEDLQGDMIDPEDLEKAAYDHVLNFRSTGERHDPQLRRKGRLVESCVFTKEKQTAIGIPPGTVPEGWWVGYKIDDPAAWEKIKSGEYQSFSVEGKGERTPIKKAHVAKSYAQMRKFNPYHDTKGRFASKPGGSGEASQEFMMNRITLRDIANMKTIKSIIEDNEFTHYGFRMQEEDTEKIGQEMQHLSSNWGGDFDDPYKGPIIEEIAGELDGVSTIGIQAIGEVTDIGGYSGTVVYFVGSNKWPGTGYDPGEFIMKEPTVLAKIGMKNGKLTVLDHVEIEGNQSNQRESRRSDPPKKVENPGYTAFMSQMEAKYGRDKMWESMDDDEFDRAQWWESRRYDSVAKSYDEVRKFNPYHDARGRFTSRGAHTTFSPGSDQNQARRSIDAENARRQAEGMDQLVGGAYMTIGKVEYGSALKAYLEEQAKKKDPIQPTAAPAKAGKKVDWASMTDDEFAKNLETYMPGITGIATKGWAATHDRYQYADSGLNGDMVLTDIYKARGYNALPQMMDKSAVKAYIAQNKTPELYRGMGTSSHGQSGAEKMDRFQSDPLHFAGYGVLGNGTYAAQTLPNSARNFGLRVARSYSRRGGNGTQVRMTLQKGTNTASYSTVRGQQRDFLAKLWSARYSGSIDNGLANTIQNICSDVGRFGALRGYEAWYDRGAHSGANKNNPFWVITNRGALIIQNERYS